VRHSITQNDAELKNSGCRLSLSLSKLDQMRSVLMNAIANTGLIDLILQEKESYLVAESKRCAAQTVLSVMHLSKQKERNQFVKEAKVAMSSLAAYARQERAKDCRLQNVAIDVTNMAQEFAVAQAP